MKRLQLVIVALIFISVTFLTSAQDKTDLAKQSQNPVANMISVPYQNNTNFNFGPYNRTQNVLNIQPVWHVPIKVKM
jgi:hypothetical protein